MNRTLRRHGQGGHATDREARSVAGGDDIGVVDVDRDTIRGVDDYWDGAEAKVDLRLVELDAAEGRASDLVREGDLPVRVDAELVDGLGTCTHGGIYANELVALSELDTSEGHSDHNATGGPFDEGDAVARPYVLIKHECSDTN
jgi:hypothetical protein